MNTYHGRSIGLLLILGAWGLVGCASTPKIQSMIPRETELVFESTDATLSVGDVQGGHETDALGVSKINAGTFRLALIEALRQSNLFTEVTSASEADYGLSATILTQDQPGFGLAMTVTLSVRYMITNNETGEEVFNDRIVSSYKAGVGEALVGSVRVRKANEGAVRENFKELLKQIAALPLEDQ